MTQEELLKEPEQKQENSNEHVEAQSSSFDANKYQRLIKIRLEKLESIKQFIPLKTYNLISEKLHSESQTLNKTITVKQKQAQIQNQEQSLPKAFFELQLMKPRTIRID
ncbi:MAG: hypothetical protein AAB351_02025 [Patescibacteria group bacterium]